MLCTFIARPHFPSFISFTSLFAFVVHFVYVPLRLLIFIHLQRQIIVAAVIWHLFVVLAPPLFWLLWIVSLSFLSVLVLVSLLSWLWQGSYSVSWVLQSSSIAIVPMLAVLNSTPWLVGCAHCAHCAHCACCLCCSLVLLLHPWLLNTDSNLLWWSCWCHSLLHWYTFSGNIWIFKNVWH